MREIKFKYVIERDGVKYLSGEYELGESGLPSYEQVIEDMQGGCQCCLSESNNFCDGSCDEWHDAEVVDKVQWAGRKSMQDCDLYDGHIVNAYDGNGDLVGTGQIEWLDEQCIWYISGNIHNGLGDVLMDYDLEIIGNIHENSELINQGE